MFLGHYGVAFAAKRVTPETSLGTLTFAAQWLDELWPLLLLAGVEQVRVTSSTTPVLQVEFVSYPISHSLATAIGWGIVIGLAYFAIRRRPRVAWIVGALVLSHWMLDLVVHIPDLPLYPGGPRVGLGAWRSLPLTLCLEAIVYGAGLLVYTRATVPIDGVGRWGLWTLVAFQVVAYLGSLSGPPPSNAQILAISALALWLFVPWTAWVDRHRRPGPMLATGTRS